MTESQLEEKSADAQSADLRREGDILVSGGGTYVNDIELPGMLHAAILRSPHPHARIVSVDVSPALARPGVHCAIGGAEAVELAGPLPHFFDPSIIGGKTAEFRVLAVDRVRWVGEPVAAVVAGSLADAEAALEHIDVVYELLPAVIEIDEALAEGAQTVFDEWGDNVLVDLPFVEGDADAELAACDHTLSGEFEQHRLQTAPMEPRGYLGHWERGERVTLYASTQNPHPVRTTLATVLDLPETRIRVVAPRLGGGFGQKFNGYAEEPLVCVLSRLAGAPVKWVETRADSLLIGAREYRHRFTIGFDDDGRVRAIRDRIWGNIGCLATWGGWSMTYPAGMIFPGPYKIHHYAVESMAVVTNKAPWNGARGYGKESGCVALERMMDLVAEHLGMDPAELRRRNFIPADEFPYWFAMKHLDSGNYEGVLDKLLTLVDYDGLREEQRRAREEGRLFGVGLAFELTPEGGDFAGSFVRGFDTSTVRLSPTGTATVLTGVTSPGTGNETSIAWVVARELGIPADSVEVVQGDTDSCPFGFGNFSSRSLTAGGGAAVLAARELRDRIAAAAALMLETEAAPEELRFEAGLIVAPGGDSIEFTAVCEEIFKRAYATPGLWEGQLEVTRTDLPHNFHHVPDKLGRMSAYPSFPNSAHLCVCEIDREMGLVDILRYAYVDDCGVVISPRFVEGQVNGAVAMGIGAALWEHLPYSPDGQPLACHLKAYVPPRASDLPAFESDRQVTPSPYTTLGTKGAGETGVGGSMASTANAVNDALSALGVKLHRTPFNGPNVLAAIRGAKAG
ncbi:MAG TPA: xanthine dehydrogenase family protein molybdopterin-binding subunit [Solirubrobacterales bacterium]|nr:xanthine dehydrogenase family protein molybdopterin-binding subunit [Solirubrobacterales bacterium]